jgi:hypothetical protein
MVTSKARDEIKEHCCLWYWTTVCQTEASRATFKGLESKIRAQGVTADE